jgi:hypothetical protein
MPRARLRTPTFELAKAVVHIPAAAFIFGLEEHPPTLLLASNAVALC